MLEIRRILDGLGSFKVRTVVIRPDANDRQADDGLPQKGFEMEQRMAIRGAPVTVTWELDTVEHPTRATWNGTGPARATAFIEYRLEPIEGGTRFHYTNDFTPPMGVLGRVASRALMGGVPEREANASLERLRDLLAG